MSTADIQMKCRCDNRSCDCDLSNRKLSPKNVFGASTGPEPVVSALALHCSIKWPAPNVGVFIAQLVEHCRANAEVRNHNCDDHIFTV